MHADSNIERLLQHAYRPEEPDPDFVTRMGSLLQQAAAERIAAPPQILRHRRRLAWVVSAAAALVLIALTAYALRPLPDAPGDLGPALAGTSVASKELAPAPGLTARPRPPGPAAQPVAIGADVVTRAGERRRVSLPDGSVLYVNQGTTAKVESARRIALASGEVFVEVAPMAGEQFVVQAADRTVAALGTKFVVRVDDAPRVVVTQGKVQVEGTREHVHAGEQLVLATGRIAPAPRSSHLLDWARELMAAAESPLVPASKHTGGALLAVDPNGQEAKLSLRKYHVDVHVEDGFARTTIDQTYFNHTPSRLEGTFYFPLPADASLSHLAMYVDGVLMQGGMCERDHARQVFETILHTQRDPALLEWVDGSTFKMRVFPLEARQEKRILLSYTQRLDTLYGLTKYRFPAGHNLEAVGVWSFHAHIKRGGDLRWRCDSHALAATQRNGDLVLEARRENVKLDRDLTLTLHDAPASGGLRFSSADHDGSRYLMVRYRPELGARVTRQRRDWVFLFESSGSRDPLLARVQIDVLRTILSNAERDDTFAVVTAGTRAQTYATGSVLVTPESVRQAVQWLEHTHLVGALDLAKGLAACGPFLRAGQNPYLVHLGSGISTNGERREGVLAQSIPERVRYVGVGVGKRWSRGFMKQAAERSGGFFTQINPDEPIAWRAFDLLATLNTPRLLDVRVHDDAEKLAFHCHSTLLTDGEELCAIARVGTTSDPLPKAVAITGRIDGKPFTTTVPVRNVAPKADYLPRTWARLEIDRLLAADAQANKAKLIELSKAMYVMTPFTSLLVLENEQMYAQFNVDRGRKDHWALYQSPEKIPVVHEPLPGSVPAAPAVSAGQKPTPEAVLATLLVRLPPQILHYPGQPDPYRGHVVATALQLYQGAFGVPDLPAKALYEFKEIDRRLAKDVKDSFRARTDAWSRWNPDLRWEMPLGERWEVGREQAALAQRLLERRDNSREDVERLLFRQAPQNTRDPRSPLGLLSEQTLRADTSAFETFQGSFGRKQRGGSSSDGRATTSPYSHGFLPPAFLPDFRGAPAARGLPRGGPVPLSASANPQVWSEALDGFRERAQTRVPGKINLNTVWDEEELFSLFKKESVFRSALNDAENPQGERGSEGTASRLGYGAIPISNPATLLLKRPTFTGDSRVFRDLVAYAPAMNTTAADIQAVLEAEAHLPLVPAGTVDPAARALVERARGGGWQSVRLRDFSVTFDGTGRYVSTRMLGSGLREQGVCDGTTLLHFYPELGLGARRTLSRFHQAWLHDLIPWTLPPVEALSRGTDVSLAGERIVALKPHGVAADKGKDGPSIAHAVLHLVFAPEGRLAERRLLEMPAATLRYRETYSPDGQVRLLDDAGKVLDEYTLTLHPAAAPNLRPDVSNLVVLPLPLRTMDAVARQYPQEKVDGNFEKLSDEAALAVFAARYGAGEGTTALNLFGNRYHRKGDRRLGFYTLLAASPVTFHPEQDYWTGAYTVKLDPVGEHQNHPLAQYLVRHNALATGGGTAIGALGGDSSGFVQQLAAFRDLWHYWHGGKPGSTGVEPWAHWDRAHAFALGCKSPTLKWATLDLLQRHQVNHQERATQLADAYREASAHPSLHFLAWYERARTLANAGNHADSRRQFEELYTRVLESGVLPPIDQAFHQAFHQTPEGREAWNALLRKASRQLLAEKRHGDLLSLAWQCHQVGDSNLAGELVGKVLHGLGDEIRPVLTLAVVDYWLFVGQIPRALALLEGLLEGEELAEQPALLRFAAQLALQQGKTARGIRFLEQALDVEYRNLPAVVNLQGIRQQYGELLDLYQQLALAVHMIEATPPRDLVARVLRFADRWRALDSDPTTACQAAARVFQHLGLRELAWDYVTTPVDLKPNEAAPWLSLAQYLHGGGQHELASRAYASAFEAEPTNAQILWEHAQMLQQAGRFAEVTPLYQKLAEGDWQPRFQGLKQQARQALHFP